MEQEIKTLILKIFISRQLPIILLFCLVSVSATGLNRIIAQEKKAPSGQAVSIESSNAIAEFNKRLKEYVKQREDLEGKLPKLSDHSKPEEIEAHRVSFVEKLKVERAGAKQGDLFSPDLAQHFRRVIADEFKGKKLMELRKDVRSADTKGVPLRVNSPYPETKESLEMPPTLLLKLPELPKQLRYRFVGPYLLLVDREARLILDYMPHALP